jgi:hypothetical protein
MKEVQNFRREMATSLESTTQPNSNSRMNEVCQTILIEEQLQKSFAQNYSNLSVLKEEA